VASSLSLYWETVLNKPYHRERRLTIITQWRRKRFWGMGTGSTGHAVAGISSTQSVEKFFKHILSAKLT